MKPFASIKATEVNDDRDAETQRYQVLQKIEDNFADGLIQIRNDLKAGFYLEPEGQRDEEWTKKHFASRKAVREGMQVLLNYVDYPFMSEFDQVTQEEGRNWRINGEKLEAKFSFEDGPISFSCRAIPVQVDGTGHSFHYWIYFTRRIEQDEIGLAIEIDLNGELHNAAVQAGEWTPEVRYKPFFKTNLDREGKVSGHSGPILNKVAELVFSRDPSVDIPTSLLEIESYKKAI